MKLPGDSDKQQAVSHEMMQRSLQSQRRVVKRVGLLEDKVEELEKVEERVDDIESAEIEPGTKLGDIAKGIGKSIGKNAALLADKAGKGLAKAGKSAATAAGKGIKSAADATGKGIKKGVKGAVDATGKGIKDAAKKTGKGIKNVGKGISDFIKDKTKLKKSLGKDKPKSKDDKDKPDKDQTTSGADNVKPPASPKQPLDPLIPDPIAAQSKDKDGNTIYDKNERVRPVSYTHLTLPTSPHV